MKKFMNVAELLFILLVFLSCSNAKVEDQKSNVIIIQPIITQSDIGNEPAKINLSEKVS